MLNKFIASSVCLVTLAGCASWTDETDATLAQKGAGTTFNPDSIKTYAANQAKVLTELNALTGLTTPSWDQVIQAGIQYSDSRCDAYIGALYRVNKDLKADVQKLNSVGTATAALMGITKSAATEIAAAAVLFGYAEESINISGSRILFEMDPASIRSLVKGSQTAFKSALEPNYQDRTGAFTVIREYITLCLPSTIEAEINNAAKNAVQIASSGNPAKGVAPAVSINESQVKAKVLTYDADVYSLLLKSYAFPGGTKEVTAHAQLKTWMVGKNIKVPVGPFLMSQSYKEQWREAVDYLRKNGNPKLD